MKLLVWLLRDVAYHPRGYYRLARSIAKKHEVEVWGRPIAPPTIEGPLRVHIDLRVWELLCTPPSYPLTYIINDCLPPAPSAPVIACNPLDMPILLYYLERPLIWDVWEDYRKNYRYEPSYSSYQRFIRRLGWNFLQPLLKRLPIYFSLAEYAYAGLTPFSRSIFLPNAFVSVEGASPLLPELVGKYFLYTGNFSPGWGFWEAVEKALAHPKKPFVFAGSLKSSVVEKRLLERLRDHKAWLGIWGRFIPYPVIQNLQRHCKVLYALYQPLPHLVGKIPSKFYEAAALGIPCIYPEGVSSIWDAFWKNYRDYPQAPRLYWEFYESLLEEGIAIATKAFYGF
ncbi:MAG: hypothetical protein RMJ66_02490 [Bacteroidia bacterium]|nr:hypothetical protein [Bacteroidia bacterium]MDW8133913.1 hypothetical protein [Bacteroidia bacterium]